MTPTFSESLREVLFALLQQPTAPFHEDAVAAEIIRLLADCPHVSIERDDFGNLIARYQRGEMPIRWAFAAHMDHPAWVRDPEGEWTFLGGVPKELHGFPRREYGPFAVWDLPPPALTPQGLVTAPACDDLVGCAAMVATLLELERTGAEAACAALFTRAEEVGFVGAMELADSGQIPRDWTLLSLETSKEGGPAVIGDGVIIRVGDASTLFDPTTTATLRATAIAAQLPHQRCLMSGGSCEGTAYSLAGYTTGALCVALGNYHNIGPLGRIAPEYVAWSDVEALTRLCVELVTRPASPSAALEERLAANREKHRRFHRELNPVPVRQAKGKA